MMSLHKSPCGSKMKKAIPSRNRSIAIAAIKELFPLPEIPIICLCRSKPMPERVTALLPSTVVPSGKDRGLCCKVIIYPQYCIFPCPPRTMQDLINQACFFREQGITIFEVYHLAGYQQHRKPNIYEVEKHGIVEKVAQDTRSHRQRDKDR